VSYVALTRPSTVAGGQSPVPTTVARVHAGLVGQDSSEYFCFPYQFLFSCSTLMYQVEPVSPHPEGSHRVNLPEAEDCRNLVQRFEVQNSTEYELSPFLAESTPRLHSNTSMSLLTVRILRNIDALCGQNAEFSPLKSTGTYGYHQLRKRDGSGP
jgi:hypothetical protein